MKKSSDLSRLLGYAGGRRVLTYLSWVLSAVSALVALVPFWYIWRILKEVLETAPDFSAAIHIVPWGWRAVGFAVLSVLLYIAGLMCSHLAAFRIATNLRLALTEHIARLPLGQIPGVRQRQAPPHHRRHRRGGGDLSGPPAPRPIPGHGHGGRTAGAAAGL